MKIEQLFAAVTPDGEYLHWWQVSTHVGYRWEFSTTTDIERASFTVTKGYPGQSALKDAPAHTWVPVERRTEVILKGYGT